MRTSRRVTPHVEGVESRALLSGVQAAAPAIFPPPVRVSGHAEGSALIFPSLPDVGNRYVLRGAGKVGPMGRVAVRGMLQTSSFTGRPIGTVTLANRFGRVELSITDRSAPAVPGAFQFVVSSATGAFSHLEGTGGVLELRIHGDVGRGTFEMDINPFGILSGDGP